MRNRLSLQVKDLLINKNELEIIIGCLLGDATLSTSGKLYRFRFGTVGHPELSRLRSGFFRADRSIDPSILSKISNLSIAIWFMDDGYRIHNTVGISTNNFLAPALKQLQGLFKSLGIETSLQKDKQGKRLYILSSSYRSFNNLVKPYVKQVQCMAYKRSEEH